METLLTWFTVTLTALLVSANTRVTLPVLGPEPVLGLVALAVVLAIAAILLWVVRLLVRDARRLRARMVTT